ncbi:MAG: aminotransferase class V-fold PLP-dependent enzyme [Defluviitaleaceae bacterium]|nr:aminotransferase class V-fold PLP-dependent enzyme [Defluviitaleaceae bacterium]
MIYLDHASATLANPAALAEFARVESTIPANPLSAHDAGREAADLLARATDGIASLLNIAPAGIIHTSGASEANNLAIKGITQAYKHIGRHILSTCLEHPSVSGVLAALQEDGCEIELVKILPTGQIDLAALEAAIRPDTVLLCVSAVDSELGVIQPIDAICKILQSHPNCHLHIDAAQAAGKIPLDLTAAATASISAHKFHGLAGAGILYKREGVVLAPLIHGGRSSSIYRSGTPAVGLAAATHTALEIAYANMAEDYQKVAALKSHITAAMAKYPLARINSPPGGSPYILNISVSGVKAQAFQAALNNHGVMVSTKSACATDNLPSRPVMAVTPDSSLKKKNALSSWRVSLSGQTTMAEIEGFLCAFDACYEELAEATK